MAERPRNIIFALGNIFVHDVAKNVINRFCILKGRNKSHFFGESGCSRFAFNNPSEKIEGCLYIGFACSFVNRPVVFGSAAKTLLFIADAGIDGEIADVIIADRCDVAIFPGSVLIENRFPVFKFNRGIVLLGG